MFEHIAARIPSEGRLLWVLDEADIIQAQQIVPWAARSKIITNRADIHAACRQYKLDCELSDFVLPTNKLYARVIYPLSKEKLLAAYVLARSAQCLTADGRVILSGQKNQGVKTWFDKHKGRCVHKKYGLNYIAEISAPSYDYEAASAYETELELPTLNALSVLSKPGIFGWKKIDEGSALLAQCVGDHLKTCGRDLGKINVLDLGCGYGYLSLFAASLGINHVVATDNNITAIKVCAKNFENNTIAGEAVVDDCAQSMTNTFELILCNPPFHKGKANDSALTEKFVSNAKRLLANQGQAWFVVNAFIPIERIARDYFKQQHVVVNTARFKVVRFSHA